MVGTCGGGVISESSAGSAGGGGLLAKGAALGFDVFLGAHYANAAESEPESKFGASACARQARIRRVSAMSTIKP